MSSTDAIKGFLAAGISVVEASRAGGDLVLARPFNVSSIGTTLKEALINALLVTVSLFNLKLC